MTLQTKLSTFGGILAENISNLYHYWRPDMSAPFCVWGEDGEPSSFSGNNRKGEQAISGYIDYYTKTEYDTVVDTIQNTLNTITDFPVGWHLDSVMYEEETNLIHWSWTWVIS